LLPEITQLAILGVLAIVTPLIARKFRVPSVVVEIAMGMGVGSSFLSLVQPDLPWFSFLFDFGLIYLLFLAGLEVELKFLRENLFIAWLGPRLRLSPSSLDTLWD